MNTTDEIKNYLELYRDSDNHFTDYNRALDLQLYKYAAQLLMWSTEVPEFIVAYLKGYTHTMIQLDADTIINSSTILVNPDTNEHVFLSTDDSYLELEYIQDGYKRI